MSIRERGQSSDGCVATPEHAQLDPPLAEVHYRLFKTSVNFGKCHYPYVTIVITLTNITMQIMIDR